MKASPTIGIITALSIEYLAFKALVDDNQEKNDIVGVRKYLQGSISSNTSGQYNIVLAQAGQGNNMSALCAVKLKSMYPSINTFIMIGIAGAIPHPSKTEDHVRLGDIVVSGAQGIIQYDFIKKFPNGNVYKFPPRAPLANLLFTAETMQREEKEDKFPWIEYIDSAIRIRGNEWKRPSSNQDILHDYKGEVITHPNDPDRKFLDQPRIFIDTIASGNTLLKDPILRDKLRDDLAAKAVEMESSGVADASWLDEINYFSVRGTCDYCDMYKNNIWQKYASIIAAAYTKALLVSTTINPIMSAIKAHIPENSDTQNHYLEGEIMNRVDFIRMLVKSLLQCNSIRDPSTLRTIVNNNPLMVSARIRYSPILITHLTNIIDTCMNYPNGIKDFLDIVQDYEGNSIPMENVWKIYYQFY